MFKEPISSRPNDQMYLSRRQIMKGAGLSLAASVPFVARAAKLSKISNPAMFATIPGALQRFIDRGDLAGIVALTWQNGEMVQDLALGWRDIESRAPMQRDALFRIASMTKPIVSAVVMMFIEQGKLRLGDPITKWVPELANRQVLRDPTGPLDDTVPAVREITVEDLLTHRAGLAYGFASVGPIAQAYFEVLGNPIDIRKTPDEWVKALGTLPLVYQPGDRMNYSHATDVLGIMLARIDGKPLSMVLKERLFDPLRMRDTAFYVPPERQRRIATLYEFNEQNGALVPFGRPVADTPPIFESGGAGLVASADDYLAFARMLAADGRFGGERLLAKSSVQAMCTNRLTAAQRKIPFIGRPVWTGMGFGLGLGIIDDPRASLLGYGSRGAFSWPGAFGTWWQADPVENIVMVYMIQHSIPLTADSGAVIAGGRGVAARGALPVYQKLTYDALGHPDIGGHPQI